MHFLTGHETPESGQACLFLSEISFIERLKCITLLAVEIMNF